MNANELMIGDLVYSKAKERNVRVKGVRTDCEGPVVLTDFGDVWWRLCEFEPIPLTEEILLENGFKNIESDMFPRRYFLNVGGSNEAYIQVYFNSCSQRVELVARIRYSGTKIDFSKQNMSVHELQHVMRLCGIEKEVVL